MSAVLISYVGKPRGGEAALHSMRKAGPEVSRNTADRDRALCAMQRTTKIQIVLQSPERWQYRVPSPSLGATPRPLIVIVRQAAIGDLAIDAGTAAHDARLAIILRRPVVGSIEPCDRQPDIEPVIGGIEGGQARIGVQDGWRFLAGRQVAPRFDQHHTATGRGG